MLPSLARDTQREAAHLPTRPILLAHEVVGAAKLVQSSPYANADRFGAIESRRTGNGRRHPLVS